MTTVPIPKKMRALQRDPRGYPIPYVVSRDRNGKPLFTVNNPIRVLETLVEKRCPICGSRLDKLLWFVGGPLSAFHKNGKYLDTPMHYECMHYALQVCPYLAAPQWLSGRIDSTLPPGIYFDNTMIPERPKVLVAVAALRFAVTLDGVLAYLAPERPYVAVEYWNQGKQLNEQEAQNLLNTRFFTTYGPLGRLRSRRTVLSTGKGTGNGPKQ